MSAYNSLAASYDGLTTDIPYEDILNFLETVLHHAGKAPKKVLDLACGTGSMSLCLANRGYQVIGADLSEEMLTVAAQKTAHLGEKMPFFVRQSMQRLRLPYPVDAVFCLLDSINYLTKPEDCKETFRRVFRSLTEDGVFVFDINTPVKLYGLDGQIFLDENDESYCVWRVECDEQERLCYYGIDLFQKRGTLWERSFEQHCEYIYTVEELSTWLKEAGFSRVELFGDRVIAPPKEEEQRIYFAAFKE